MLYPFRNSENLPGAQLDALVLQLQDHDSFNPNKYFIGVRMKMPKVRLGHQRDSDNMIIDNGQNGVLVAAGELFYSFH